MPAARPKADSTITMRIPAQTRDLIDRAAASIDKSRTEFVLESARQRAMDVLLDQRAFQLDEKASKAFAEALDQLLGRALGGRSLAEQAGDIAVESHYSTLT